MRMSSQNSGNEQYLSLVFGQPIIFKQLFSSESTGLIIFIFPKILGLFNLLLYAIILAVYYSAFIKEGVIMSYFIY